MFAALTHLVEVPSLQTLRAMTSMVEKSLNLLSGYTETNGVQV
jgi:hypothetical protein